MVPGDHGEWDDRTIWSDLVIHDEDIYHMWYDGYSDDTAKIGYAISPDGISWTKYTVNPVLQKGPDGSWED